MPPMRAHTPDAPCGAPSSCSHVFTKSAPYADRCSPNAGYPAGPSRCAGVASSNRNLWRQAMSGGTIARGMIAGVADVAAMTLGEKTGAADHGATQHPARREWWTTPTRNTAAPVGGGAGVERSAHPQEGFEGLGRSR